MRWAFWRRSSARGGDASARHDRPLPDGVGLPASAPRPAARAEERGDEPGPPGRSSAFSGAAPDAAAAWLAAGGGTALPAEVPLEPDEAEPREALDAAVQSLLRTAVVDAVRAVLDDDARAVDTALAPVDSSADRQAYAASVAGSALAGRLPALSGVAGPVVFDEDEVDLLRAYADLLVERVEPTRARLAPDVPHDQVLQVAHVCAAAAVGRPAQAAPGDAGRETSAATDSAGDVAARLRALPDPVAASLRAVCLLLAQTCRDGAAGPGALADELADATP